METNRQTNEIPEIKLSTNSMYYLMAITRWTKFLSIIGFFGIGLLVLAALAVIVSSPSALGAAMNPALDPAVMAISISVSYLFAAAIMLFPTIYLFNFSRKTERALVGGDQNGIEQGLRFLKKYYKYMGVLYIIMLVTIVFSISLGIVAGMSGL